MRVLCEKTKEITSDYVEWLHNELKDPEVACSHIQLALDLYMQDKNKEALLLAIKDVADARGGIGWLSKETNLNREHLYYSLSGKGNPRFDTLNLIFDALGFKLALSLCK